ncbi:MAG: hypothetical protein Q9165_008894 [Trypethelium subeluteriae]
MGTQTPIGSHGIAQPDSSPCIQEFHNWLRSNQAIGRCGRVDAGDSDAFFVPAQALEQFFTPDRLKKILKALFEAKPPASHVSPDTIRNNYLKALAILLKIGDGRYIEWFVHYPNLRDQNLPFFDRPQNFPITTGSGPDLFRRFTESQWSFCAPIIKYDIDTRWEPDRILPILCKEKKGEGASGATYRIELHPTHNELGLYNNDSEILPGNVYALKTFHAYSEQFYEKELQSFSFLLDQVRRHRNAGLIGFYGSFRHGSRLNILLEYADGGTLEEYFKQHSPPSRGVEIIDFWESLSGILKGLHAIHFVMEDDQEQALLLGYHQDITPKNILCCMCDSKSPYRCYFKLGDLGVSHFTKRILVHDAGGTKTYGAPECYDYDDYFTKTPRKISNKVDIWSVGAIFSEAIEWSVHGYNGLERYRQQRSQEHSHIHDFRDTGCFHDGNALLSTVGSIHEGVRYDLRLSDTITDGSDGVPGILSITEEMLGWDSSERPEAAGASKRIQNMISASRTNLDRRLAARPPIHPMRASTVNTAQLSREWDKPKFVNESHPAEGIEAAGVTSSLQNSTAGPSSRTNIPSSYPTSPQRYSSIALSQDLSPGDPADADPFVGSRGGMAGRKAFDAGNIQAEPYSIHYERPSMKTGAPDVHRISHSVDGYPSAQLAERPRDGALPTNLYRSLEEAQHIATEEQPNTNHHGMTHSPPVMDPLSTPPQSSGTQQTQPSPADISSSLYVANHGAPISVRAVTTEVSERPPPDVPMREALSWRRQIKSGFIRQSLRYEEDLKHQIEARDHVFLLDNSLSNGDNWDDVVDVVDCLTYMVKDADPDGVDIYLAHGQKKERKCRPDKAVKFARQNRPPKSSGNSSTPSTIAPTLGMILHNYQEKLRTPAKKSGFGKIERLLGHSPLRPLSLYILTDGRWQPKDNIEKPILSLIKTLNERDDLTEQVGIQFIQFGHHPATHQNGQSWLDFLDSGLEEYAAKDREDLGKFRDIIDTEHSTGNFWKMLLGSINRWFDQSNEVVPAWSSSTQQTG